MILDKHLNQPHIQPHQTSIFNLPIIISLIFWFSFLGNLSYLAYQFPNMPKWDYQNLIHINGFTLVIWTTVTFFSAILSSYASNYLKGFKYKNRFMILCFGFTISVMLFIASNHIALLLASWFSMGVFMSKLIGVNASWGEAKEASKFAQKYFLAGSIFLCAFISISIQ